MSYTVHYGIGSAGISVSAGAVAASVRGVSDTTTAETG